MAKEPKMEPIIDLIWTIEEEEDLNTVTPQLITWGCAVGSNCSSCYIGYTCS